MNFTYKIILSFVAVCFAIGGWLLYSEIYQVETRQKKVEFELDQGVTVNQLTDKLTQQNIVRSGFLFRQYLTWTGLDTQIGAGRFEVKPPITLARVAQSLKNPSARVEKITIIPGWSLHEIADYFQKNNITTKENFLDLVGKPAEQTNQNYTKIFKNQPKILDQKPLGISLEGYLKPDTFEIYRNSSGKGVVKKLITARNREISDDLYQDIKQSKYNFHEILTMASILEREVKSTKEKRKVADIFWRRLEDGMKLQADSSVHYIYGNPDQEDAYTTDQQRNTSSPYNTYHTTGLPPGPISNPSIESIKAAVYPEENDYWYFLTDVNGNVHYAETLLEHNRNRQLYLQ